MGVQPYQVNLEWAGQHRTAGPLGTVKHLPWRQLTLCLCLPEIRETAASVSISSAHCLVSQVTLKLAGQWPLIAPSEGDWVALVPTGPPWEECLDSEEDWTLRVPGPLQRSVSLREAAVGRLSQRPRGLLVEQRKGAGPQPCGHMHIHRHLLGILCGWWMDGRDPWVPTSGP